MFRKTCAALASALLLLLTLAEAPRASATHEGRGHERGSDGARARRRAPKARKRPARHAVSYACPMHPDMRSDSPGECPKCRMALVAVRARA